VELGLELEMKRKLSFKIARLQDFRDFSGFPGFFQDFFQDFSDFPGFL